MSTDMRLGHGGRFKQLSEKLARKGVRDPKALAAHIGLKKYGKEKMTKWAEEGKERAGE